MMRTRWEIGFVSGGLDAIMKGEPVHVDYIKHSFKDRWFADPFILNVTDSEIELLVEEFIFEHPVGRISKLKIDRSSNRVTELRTILELDTHLSFPAIIHKEDKIFIYPESWATGKVVLYDITGTLEKGDKPIPIDCVLDESVADSIITDKLGEKMLFTTKDDSTLLIFDLSAEEPTLKKSILFKDITARNAGDLFYYDNWYRPAQVCTHQYGEAIEIQQIAIKDGEISFIPFRRLLSTHTKYNTGMHTLNTYGNEVVVDVRGYEKPWFAKTVLALKHRIMGKDWHRKKR